MDAKDAKELNVTGTRSIAPRDRIRFDPTPIIRAMTIKDLSLVQLAAKVGNKCSGNAVWRITNAKTTRPKYLHAICKVLRVKVEDCYPLGLPPPDEPMPVFDATPLRIAYRKTGRCFRWLSNQVGCSRQAIQQILNGRNRGGGELVPKIAKILGVDLADCYKIEKTEAAK